MRGCPAVSGALLAVLAAGCASPGESGPGGSAPGGPAPEAPTGWAGGGPEGRDVRTASGDVRGFADRYDTWVWKAIPYARPPVGEMRWRAPEPPEAWSGVRVRRRWAKPCTQYTILGTITGSEDCLYLNVWRPRSNQENLPVYVWIHGGGNAVGWATQVPDYEGASLAARLGVVFVSVNYRLGPLGWFRHPALRTGDPADDSGNYGTLDIIRSLEWIQENIGAFGGDPRAVTVAGESAGAINILSLLISPPARGLFARAVVRSGVPMAAGVETADKRGVEVAEKILGRRGDPPSEDTAALLRAAPARELLGCYERLGFGMIGFPNIFPDGHVIPEEGYDALRTGEFAGVDMIVGGNTDEVRLFLGWDGLWRRNPDVYRALTRYGSDLWRAAGVDGVADLITAHPSETGVYVYEFGWGSPDEEGASPLPGRWGDRLGAAHSMEIPFFHGVGERSFLRSFAFTRGNRPGREALTDAIISYLRGFVSSGTPSSPPGLPQWPRWSAAEGRDSYLVLDAGPRKQEIRIESGSLSLAEVDARLRDGVPADILEEVQRLLEEGNMLSSIREAQQGSTR